jgi:hypothetical protein
MYLTSGSFYYIFCTTLSEFENFLLCEPILIKILRDLEPLKGARRTKKRLFVALVGQLYQQSMLLW